MWVKLSWVQQKEVCEYIKRNLLDTKVLKPLPHLDRSKVIASKKDNHGHIEDEVWYCLVKRASAEWIDQQPGEVSPVSSPEKYSTASRNKVSLVAFILFNRRHE